MKKLITLALVAVIALSILSMMPEESQAVWFYPDDCVENGTPIQNMHCLWYLQIAIMHDDGFHGLYGMMAPAPDNSEEVIPTLENTVAEPTYAVNTTKKSVTWYLLRA